LFQRRYAAAIEIFSNAVAADGKRDGPTDYEKLLLGLSQQSAGDVAAARVTYQSAVQGMRRDPREGRTGFLSRGGAACLFGSGLCRFRRSGLCYRRRTK